jgi:hypothetical protein
MINPKLFIPNKSKIVYSICGIQVDVDAAIRPTYLFASGIYDKIILGQLRQLGIHRKKKKTVRKFNESSVTHFWFIINLPSQIKNKKSN